MLLTGLIQTKLECSDHPGGEAESDIMLWTRRGNQGGEGDMEVMPCEMCMKGSVILSWETQNRGLIFRDDCVETDLLGVAPGS